MRWQKDKALNEVCCDFAAQGEAYACCNLGVLHYRHQQYDDALTYFERFFEAARALKDQHVLDVARLNLGAARAALNFSDYVQVIAHMPRKHAWQRLHLLHLVECV